MLVLLKLHRGSVVSANKIIDGEMHVAKVKS